MLICRVYVLWKYTKAALGQISRENIFLNLQTYEIKTHVSLKLKLDKE